MPGDILKAELLSIGYPQGRRPPYVVGQDISVSLEAGELSCLIGPNGAGKSTLMRTLAGMQRPLGGEVRLLGRDLRKIRSRELARILAVVLTERVSVGILTAEALVSLGRYPYTDWTGRLTSKDMEIVRRAIQMVGAEHLADRNFSDLSDGERQKIMIARALAQEPQVLILDEVTAFLDLPRRVEIMGILRDLARVHGKAVLISSHELDLALRSADRIWLLPPGGPLQIGAPEDLVLSGAFAQVFSSEGVKFDSQKGAFQILAANSGSVRLIAEGIHRFWTAHALEREGFAIADAAADLEVTVSLENGQPSWETLREGVTYRHGSLYELLLFLRRFSP